MEAHTTAAIAATQAPSADDDTPVVIQPRRVTVAATTSAPATAAIPTVEAPQTPVMTAAPATLRASEPDLVSLVLSPYLTDDQGGAPTDSPLMWSMLAWTRRQASPASDPESSSDGAQSMFQRSVVVTSTVTNDQPPNAAPVAAAPTVGAPDPVTGAVTGSLNFTDPDGDTLAYTVADAPTKGSVVINADGTFTYTPTQAARLRAYSNPGPDADTFNVTVSDGQATAGVTVSPAIDPAQFAVGAGTHVGYSPVGVASSPDGSRLYVANNGGDDVSVVDTATNTVVTSIRVGSGPAGVAVSPDGTRLYVGLTGDVDGIAVVDTATHAVLTTIVADGTIPVSIVVSRDGYRAYVANEGDNTMSVIDTTTNTVIAKVAVGDSPRKVALSPDGSRAYVASIDYSTRVIDTATNTVVATIPEFSGVLGIAVSPDGKVIYATNYSPNQVSVINPVTSTVVRSISGFGGGPQNVEFSPDSSLAYVSNSYNGTVSVVDTAAGQVVANLTIGQNAYGVAVGPDGRNAYVTSLADDSVTAISLVHAANRAPVAGAITLGTPDALTGAVKGAVAFTDPDGDALSYSVTTAPTKGTLVVRPDGTFTYTPTGRARLDAYATPDSDMDAFAISATDGLGGSTTVSVNAVPITPAEAAVTATLGISSAHGVVISPDSTRAYVARLDGTVSVVDTSTGTVLATINVGGLPRYPAITPDGAHVYVANQYPGNVAVIDTATNTVTATINVGEGAYDVAIDRDGARAYVTNVNTGTLSVIDTASNTVTATINVSPDVRLVALSSDGSRAYVTDPRTGVIVVDTATNTVIETIYDGAAQDVVFSPDGSHAYTTRFNNFVTVIDTSTNAVTSFIDVGQSPAGIAISRDGSRVYATTVGDNTVKVIDTVTNTVIDTVAVGNFPIDIAVSPDGAFAYVTNVGAGTVSVITFANRAHTNGAPVAGTPTVGAADPVTGRVTGTLNFTDPDGDPLTYTVTGNPVKGRLVVDANGAFTYTPTDAARLAAYRTPGIDTDSFTVTASDGRVATTTTVSTPIDAAKLAVLATIPVNGNPVDLVITPDGSYAYIVNPIGGSTKVTVVDTKTNTQTATVDTDGLPRFVAVSPDGTHIYSTNIQPGTLAVIDTATNTQVAAIPVGSSPIGVAVAPNGNRVYVANLSDNTVSVIDTTTYAVVSAIATSSRPYGVAVSPDSTRVYVTNSENPGLVTVIDAGTNSVVTTIAVGNSPTSIAMDPSGARLYVSNFSDRSVSVIDTATNAVTATIVVSADSNTAVFDIALSPDGSLAYLPGGPADSLVVLDTTTNTVVDTIAVGRFPVGVAVNPANGYAYVSNQEAKTVSVVALVSSPGSTNAAPTLTVTQVGGADPITGAITFQANANDPDGDPLTYSITAATAKGAVTPNADGTYTYTPSDYARHAASADAATAADKADSFFITVTDPSGASATVTTAVVITPKNATPNGGMSSSTVDFSTGVVTGTFALGDQDGDVLSYTGTTDTAKGHLTVNPDGTFVYTPTDAARHAASSLTASPTDQMDVVSFVANDGHGGIVSAQINVPLIPKNSAPTAGTTTAVFSGTTGATTGSIGAIDADADMLTYRLTGNATKGTVTVNSDGTYSYNTNAANRHVAAADTATAAQRQDTFTVSVADAHGGVTPLTVTTQINPQNSAPTVTLTQSGNPNATTGAVTYAVTARDTDGDPLTYTITTSPTKGAVVRNANGTYTYTPAAAARHDAALATATTAQKQDTFTVTITDAHGGATPATATPTISGKNAAPTVTLAQIGSADATTGAVTYQINGSDPDGDALSYNVTTSPAKGVAVVNTNGTLTYTPTDSARHAASTTTATTAQKQDTFTVTANDAHGALAVATTRVTISPRNAAPVVTLSQVGTEDVSTGAITYVANGIDPDGDTLTYTVIGRPTRGSVVRNADGTFTYTPTATARHAASADTATPAQRLDSFTVTANDAHGLTTAASATPAISPKNSTPTVTLTQVGSANATTGAVIYRTTVNDPDGDTLSYTITADPTKGSVVRNTNGTYTYTPTAAARHAAAADAATADQKLDTFGITANDAHGASTIATASPTISPKNTGPSTAPTVAAPNADGTVTGAVGGSDADGDTLTYSVTTGPAKGTVTVNPNGTFTYDPSAAARHAASADNATAAQKRDTFTVGVTDGYGGTRTVTVTTQISPKNAGPRATPSATNTSITTGSVSGAVAGSDLDADSLVYTVTSRPTKGALTVNPDGTLTYTPTAAARTAASRPNATAAQKQDTFSVSVKDGHGGTTVVTYTVPLSLTSSDSVVIVVNPPSALAT